MINLIISIEFSDTPGPRHKVEGEFSGEEFRGDYLIPKYLRAKEAAEKLHIDLDGGFGYATSFLEESFGGLARIYDSKDILSTLIFKSDDQPSLIDKIISYIENARK